jgi:Ca2+-binding EF-hand superfamily protein
MMEEFKNTFDKSDSSGTGLLNHADFKNFMAAQNENNKKRFG